jgi:hypothetical protein
MKHKIIYYIANKVFVHFRMNTKKYRTYHWFDVSGNNVPAFIRFFFRKSFKTLDKEIAIQKETLLYDAKSFYNGLVYKDETWNYIKAILPILAVTSLKLPVLVHNNECENKKVSFDNNKIKIQSKRLPLGDWVFLQFDKFIDNPYVLEFRTVVKSVFTEFQIAFNYSHLGKRYRFTVVNNECLSFDVVDFGYFFTSISKVPFSFVLGREYSIAIIAKENCYSFVVDGATIMTIKDNFAFNTKGGITLIFYHQTQGITAKKGVTSSNIDLELNSVEIYSIK